MNIEVALISALASFVGAWIASRLALARFSREKIWERKTAAYTAIFEALHFIGRWYEKHLDATMTRKDIDEEITKQLKLDSKKAEDELERRLGSETWLIPQQCRARLEKMTLELENSAFKNTQWEPFLDEGAHIVRTATNELRLMVVDDLGLNRKWYDWLLELIPFRRG